MTMRRKARQVVNRRNADALHRASKEQLKRLHATVYGLVQGVGFRYFTLWQASDIGVTGYVRNLANGAVEVVAEGTQTQLEKLLKKLQQGPPAARVERVIAHWEDARGEFDRFGVRF